ncbi:MAG: 4'-phosphopantetheinyl transferase, partial [Oscillibacter sp.]|nr:4'-phosphopantetheinyl transferase [Oscillibacter sp.]
MQTVLFAARLTRELSGGERKRLFACLPPERQARFRRGIARDEILCAYGLLCAALYTMLDWRELPPVA